MTMSVAAKQAKGKKAKDVIFATNYLAQQMAKELGKENVLNGTVGSILDENGDIVFIKAVEDEYRSLPKNELVSYAPIEGVKEYTEAVIQECFGESKPDGYITAIATVGGTGALHHLVHNYTEPHTKFITTDWCWGAYRQICEDNQREFVTFPLFTEDFTFNIEAMKATVLEAAATQENILVVLNTPGNNPTGYTIPDKDWDVILDFFKELVAQGKNKVIIGIDVAYIDYSGPKQEVRKFFKKFGNLPAEILTVVCYSLSKGFTLYGQRVGCMVGITSSEEVNQEFFDVNQMTSRGTWSNICRPAMRAMANIVQEPEKLKRHEEERGEYAHLVEERAAILEKEGAELGLPLLPYNGGFFMTVLSTDSHAVVEELKKEHVYLIPLAKGVRIAVCSIPKRQITGLAARIHAAMKRLGQL